MELAARTGCIRRPGRAAGLTVAPAKLRRGSSNLTTGTDYMHRLTVLARRRLNSRPPKFSRSSQTPSLFDFSKLTDTAARALVLGTELPWYYQLFMKTAKAHIEARQDRLRRTSRSIFSRHIAFIAVLAAWRKNPHYFPKSTLFACLQPVPVVTVVSDLSSVPRFRFCWSTAPVCPSVSLGKFCFALIPVPRAICVAFVLARQRKEYVDPY